MQIPGLSTQAYKYQYNQNRYKYNGIEYDSAFGLDYYEAFYRNLDPQIGRWTTIDSKIEDGQESISPYVSMNNNPVRLIDPKGDVPCCETAAAVWQTTQQISDQIVIAGGGEEDVAADFVATAVDIIGGVAAGVGALWDLWTGTRTTSPPVPVKLTAPTGITTDPKFAPPKTITPAKVATPPRGISPTQAPGNTKVDAHGQKKQSTGSFKKSGDNHMRQYKSNKKGNKKNPNQRRGAENRKVKNKPID